QRLGRAGLVQRGSQRLLRLLRQCGTCHEGGQAPSVRERKMYDGIDVTGVGLQNPAMTWEFVDRLRKATAVKLFIKGIDTREDAPRRPLQTSTVPALPRRIGISEVPQRDIVRSAMPQLILLALLLFVPAGLLRAQSQNLDIYWIDVEGGAATLIVSPSGESL